MTPSGRLVSKWRVDASGCWVWLGTLQRGYAWDGRPAHRKVYEQLVGPLPADGDLHHRCRNRACVNPDHMEPIDAREHRAMHGRERRTLTDEQIREARSLAEEPDLTYAEIAVLSGVAAGTVQSVVHARGRYAVHGARVYPERCCGYCGAAIEGRRRGARYCSDTHRKYAWRDQHALA